MSISVDGNTSGEIIYRKTFSFHHAYEGDQKVCALMLQLFNDIRYQNDFGDLLI